MGSQEKERPYLWEPPARAKVLTPRSHGIPPSVTVSVKEIPAASCELELTRMTFFASQMQTHGFWNIFHHTISIQMVFMELICSQKLVFLSWIFHGFPILRKAAFEEAQPQVSGITFRERGFKAVHKDCSHHPWAEGQNQHCQPLCSTTVGEKCPPMQRSCCSLSQGPTLPCSSQAGHHHKEVTVRDTDLHGGKQANSSNLLKCFSINSPVPFLACSQIPFSLSPGGLTHCSCRLSYYQLSHSLCTTAVVGP